MEQLSTLLQGLQSSARAQAVLKPLLVILDDVLTHMPQAPAVGQDSHRHVRHDELTPVAARLLKSCGFLEEPGSGELRLPLDADLQKLREAREDVALLLRKAELAGEGAAAAAAATPSGNGGAASTGPLAAASSAAMALQLAALSVSPTATLPQLLTSPASDEVLGAADPSSIKPRSRLADGKDGPSKISRTVPASVANAAAAVGQAVVSGSGAGSLLGVGNLARGGLARNPEPTQQQKAGGRSRWVAGPPNVLPESRLVVALPEAEFTYIERPWSHFVTRWAAIDVELGRSFGEDPFTLLDLGSCCGFFSLQAAAGYPSSLVIGIEGSVGIGNGTTGVSGTEDQIIATKAIQTHLRWIDKLQLPNGLLAPEVWDYRRVCQLSALGPICDALLSLSVVHHIDSISTQQYTAAGLSHLQGTLSLMTKLLDLAPRHFIELPDRPWIEHVHNAYGTARAFLEAAVQSSGRPWNFVGPLVISEWYGTRELWLLEDAGQVRNTIPQQGLKALFPRVLGVSSSPARQKPVSLPSHFDNVVGAPGAAGGPTFQPQRQALPPQDSAELSRSVQTPFPQQASIAGAVGSPMTAEELGMALLSAPTALIASHVQLRDALAAAEGMIQHSHSLK